MSQSLYNDKGCPDIDPSTMPIGILVPGSNLNIYIVSPEYRWRVFCKSERRIIRIIAECCDCEIVEMFDFPSIDEVDVPDIINIDAHSANPACEENNDNSYVTLPSERRGRGRPRKVIKPQAVNRYGRAPTEYNSFMKQEMAKLSHIQDTRNKMKIIAQLWKQYKDNA